jgi:hypothetical protein
MLRKNLFASQSFEAVLATEVLEKRVEEVGVLNNRLNEAYEVTK